MKEFSREEEFELTIGTATITAREAVLWAGTGAVAYLQHIGKPLNRKEAEDLASMMIFTIRQFQRVKAGGEMKLVGSTDADKVAILRDAFPDLRPNSEEKG